MEKIRIVIVDDEPPARRGIRNQLIQFPEAIIIGEASTGEEAIELIQRETPDLVFLDIQMPFLNGLEVIDRIGPEQFPAVVFVTAFDQYALEAFKVHAVDYILKPIDPKRFEKAYGRVKERIRLGEISEKNHEIDSLIKLFQKSIDPGKKSIRNRLVIQDAGKAFFLDYDDIEWIESSGNYLNINLKDKPHPLLIRETMQKMEEQLKGYSFLRIHRSKIVNLDNVSQMERQSDGRYILKLRKGAKLISSRRYRDLIDERLSDLK